MSHADVCIIGAGPSGLFTVFQCGMLGLKCHVIDALDHVGGQCAALYPEKPIYDIPAAPEILAGDLVAQLERQAAPFGPEYRLGQQVVSVDPVATGGWRVETADGATVTAGAVILAAGAGAFGPNRPPLEGIRSYENRGDGTGVHYAVRRKEDFRDRGVVIAGGGDSAVDWALALAEVAAAVTVVHRRPRFRAAPESVARMQALADQGRIAIRTPYQLHGLKGAGGVLRGVALRSMDGDETTIDAEALLAFFGLTKDLGPLADWGLEIAGGQIPVDPATCETARPGIYAVGDIAGYPGKLKLILSGFAEAATAAHAAYGRIHPDRPLHFEHSTDKGVPTAA